MTDIKLLTNRIDSTKIYPKLWERYCATLEECSKAGVDYYAISGFRDPKEQQALFDKGRTPESIAKGEKIVTKAEGFKSYHNFGLATDSCKDADLSRSGLQPNYDVKEYKLLADIAKKNGLQAGYYFSTFIDAPHLQWPLKKGITLEILKKAYLEGGLDKVWKFM